MKTDSEEYRHLCECEFILSLPFAERRPTIDRIQLRRGVEAADRIRTTLKNWHQEKLKMDMVRA